jgi:biotin synthase
MNRKQILNWLSETREDVLCELWELADRTRAEHVGESVHLRGLIEFSNYCVRGCGYCGLNAGNREIERYRMSEGEILECAELAAGMGYGTVVLQSGEDEQWRGERVANLVGEIKEGTGLAVTLSLGEADEQEYRLWKEAGADRYLLRFETSNRALFEQIHPAGKNKCTDRIEMLRTLRMLGYETGSGVMVGIPGQSYEDGANDLEMFVRLGLHMIGLGPWINHPGTVLGKKTAEGFAGQFPNSEVMTHKMLALTRILCPDTNIPSTTALATINKMDGRSGGLRRGANVVMPNLTPLKYKRLYQIYPDKAGAEESAEQMHEAVVRQIEGMGRSVSTGRGDSPAFVNQYAHGFGRKEL